MALFYFFLKTKYWKGMWLLRGYRGNTESEKKFIKDFNELCVGRNRFNVWCDFVTIAATSLANIGAPRDSIWAKREDLYFSIIHKYRKDELTLFAKLLADVTMALELNPAQDFLGNLYMMLNFGGYKGQFFTPWHVSKFMSEILFDENSINQHIKERGYFSVIDPCCGAGGMLTAFADTCKHHNLNYQQNIIFVGQDVDSIVAMMCYIQISLLGCPGYVVVGNTLTEPVQGHDLNPIMIDMSTIWFTPMWFKGWDSLSHHDDRIARILFDEESCFCSLQDLYSKLASRINILVAKSSVFDKRKIRVTKRVEERIKEYYKQKENKSTEQIEALWDEFGPSIIPGNDYVAEMENQFIYNMVLK